MEIRRQILHLRQIKLQHLLAGINGDSEAVIELIDSEKTNNMRQTAGINRPKGRSNDDNSNLVDLCCYSTGSYEWKSVV